MGFKNTDNICTSQNRFGKLRDVCIFYPAKELECEKSQHFVKRKRWIMNLLLDILVWSIRHWTFLLVICPLTSPRYYKTFKNTQLLYTTKCPIRYTYFTAVRFISRPEQFCPVYGGKERFSRIPTYLLCRNGLVSLWHKLHEKYSAGEIIYKWFFKAKCPELAFPSKINALNCILLS